MGCSNDADPNQLEARLTNGLVMGHAYSITSVLLMDIETPVCQVKCQWLGTGTRGVMKWNGKADGVTSQEDGR